MTAALRRWIAPPVVLVLAVPASCAGAFDLLRSEEATIADIHAAFTAKTLTCRRLVQLYLDRIEAYDRKGPALNAIVVTNPDALKVADALDARYAQSGPVGPMHCVPLIVKDNYETTDMPTAAGSLSLKGVDQSPPHPRAPSPPAGERSVHVFAGPAERR
jgi:amidase